MIPLVLLSCIIISSDKVSFRLRDQRYLYRHVIYQAGERAYAKALR